LHREEGVYMTKVVFSGKILAVFMAFYVLLMGLSSISYGLLARTSFVEKLSVGHFIDVPFYYQVKNYYCGPAALQMVFDYYGENISQYEIAEVARTIPYVTYTDELRRAAHFSNLSTSMGSELLENITGYTARKLGYAAFEADGMSLDDLKSLIDQDFPIILLMRWMPEEPYGHYRVAIGYNETHIFMHDPWNTSWGGSFGGPQIAMNYTFFLQMWEYSGYWGLFVSPWTISIEIPDIIYAGQQFIVKANVTYPCPEPFSHTYPAELCNATIILSEGLSLVEGESFKKSIGTLQAGAFAIVSWTVKADRTGNYNIIVNAEGKISGFVSEKPHEGLPSYNYQDRIGGCALSQAIVEEPQGIYISGIDPREAYTGTTACIFGGGATPNGTVKAFLSGPKNETTVTINVTLGQANADNKGNWEINFIVPYVPPGDYNVIVIDEETSTNDTIDFRVISTVPPPPPQSFRINNVLPSSGPPGTLVQIYGQGALGDNVLIYFNDMLVANVTTEFSGSWRATFHVPNVNSGNYIITALDAASNQTDTTIFTVTAPPIIHVYPEEAPIGSKITVIGKEFDPNTGIFLAFEDLAFFSPIYTDENGEFNVTLIIPAVNSGNYTIKAISTYYYEEGPKVLANTSFRVTLGLDTIFQKLDKIENALNQTQQATQTTQDQATSAKEAAESAGTTAIEARDYSLTAMIFAMVTTALSLITIVLKRK